MYIRETDQSWIYGVYTCRARNFLGVAESNILLRRACELILSYYSYTDAVHVVSIIIISIVIISAPGIDCCCACDVNIMLRNTVHVDGAVD